LTACVFAPSGSINNSPRCSLAANRLVPSAAIDGIPPLVSHPLLSASGPFADRRFRARRRVAIHRAIKIDRQIFDPRPVVHVHQDERLFRPKPPCPFGIGDRSLLINGRAGKRQMVSSGAVYDAAAVIRRKAKARTEQRCHMTRGWPGGNCEARRPITILTLKPRCRTQWLSQPDPEIECNLCAWSPPARHLSSMTIMRSAERQTAICELQGRR
jgi:hypothetical protein